MFRIGARRFCLAVLDLNFINTLASKDGCRHVTAGTFWGHTGDAKRSARQFEFNAVAAIVASHEHDRDPLRRTADGCGRGNDADLEPLNFFSADGCPIRWLLADERGVFDGVDTVGIGFHHHSGGQHHRQRDGCEDKADEFQATAICHVHPLGTSPMTHMAGRKFKMR